MKKTPELITAIGHVKSFFPALAIVIFVNGQWLYMDEYFMPLPFGNKIDVSILEEASDSIVDNPAIFIV